MTKAHEKLPLPPKKLSTEPDTTGFGPVPDASSDLEMQAETIGSTRAPRPREGALTQRLSMQRL